MGLQIEVVPADPGRRETLRNLMQLYLHDLSEYARDDVDARGRYGYRYLDLYWQEADRFAFLVLVDDAIAGFALVRELAPGVHQMAEFFVLRKYRRHGVGRAVALSLFARFKGRWEVAQEETNLAAQRFWRKTIGEHTNGQFEETRSIEPDGPDGPMQVFES